jgi:hypothetical protein
MIYRTPGVLNWMRFWYIVFTHITLRRRHIAQISLGFVRQSTHSGNKVRPGQDVSRALYIIRSDFNRLILRLRHSHSGLTAVYRTIEFYLILSIFSGEKSAGKFPR